MADRGKVLQALKQHLIVKDGEECVDCPYSDLFGLDCVRQLYADAVELLKAQEPRVLTLEEVQNDCPDYVYMEIASGWIECCLKDEGDSTKSVGYFVYGFDEYFIEAWREYGKTWRCWDKRPTGEQRKEVKWDAAD